MKNKEIKIELTLNSQKLHCGHNFLEDIVCKISDIKENKKIFDILSYSNNDEVREDISRNEFLSLKAIDKLLNDENIEVVDNLLSNRDINKHITNKQLNKIIKKDNTKLLCTIGKSIDEFQSCNICKVIKKLAKYPSSKVRYSLLQWSVSDMLTMKTLKLLCNDSDTDVSNEAKKELKSRLD